MCITLTLLTWILTERGLIMNLKQAKAKWPKQYKAFKKEAKEYRNKYTRAEIGEIYIYLDDDDFDCRLSWGTETAFLNLSSENAKILEVVS